MRPMTDGEKAGSHVCDPYKNVDGGGSVGDLYGFVEKVREAILGCANAFEVHSPLEGESVR